MLNDMLIVDCRDVGCLKNELLVYVADQMEAIPTLKHDQFTLSSLDDDGIIDAGETVSAIKEFLNSIDQGGNFAVISNKSMINIRSLSGTVFESDAAESQNDMFSCTHCGFVTQYEMELNMHMRIHYI